MLNVQEICQSISDKLAEELKLDQNQKAVVNYGMFAIVQTSFAILLAVVFGALLGVLVPTLIFSFVGAILRKYSGGVHADTPEACAIIGTIVSVGGALILSQVTWSINIILIMGVIIFGIAFYLVNQLAPVDSAAKPIKKAEKRQLLKKKSMITLGVYLMLSLVGLVLYQDSSNQAILLYIACLYAGVAWQVFTLTAIGHLGVSKVDFFLNKLIK